MTATKTTDLATGTIDQLNDWLVFVDVSDTSMAATGTTKKVAPRGVGEAAVSMQLTATPTTDMATGDGQAAFLVPASMNGMDLTTVLFVVKTAGTTGTCDVQVRRTRAGSDADMLTTKVTIDSTETSSATGATPAVINGSNDDLATGDLIYADVDAVQTTKAKGGMLVLGFKLP